MKIRNSGMPEPQVWDAFFDTERILRALGLSSNCRDVVEFGCGYGTFTVPAGRIVLGTVRALDIDAAMIATARRRAEACGVSNVEFILRDFVAHGTGLPDASADYAMLFNILHDKEPVRLLREALRNLRDGGLAGVIHWIHDSVTPRGPPLEIRPRPEQCRGWAIDAGFSVCGDTIELPPYHYGLLLRREPAAH